MIFGRKKKEKKKSFVARTCSSHVTKIGRSVYLRDFTLIKCSSSVLPFEMNPFFSSATYLGNKHAVKILNVSNYLNIRNSIKLLFVLLECTHISNLDLLYLVILIIFELEVV